MRKSNILKKLAALAFSAMLTAAVTVTAFAADSKVTYQGGADAFVMIPENTDLFQNFKGVMPGDTLSQPITVKNTVSKSGGVKIYLRADSADETVKGFLKQMTLQVKQGDKVLSEASSDQKAGLTENVLLGTFSKDADTQLEAVLTVPITMGNEFQDAKGTIVWTFTAEEITSSGGNKPGGNDGNEGGGRTPSKVIPTNPVPQAPGPVEIIEELIPEGVPLAVLPKTGDGSISLVTLALLMAVSGVLVTGMIRRRRKEEK